MAGIGKYLPLNCLSNGERSQEIFKADWQIVEFLPEGYNPELNQVLYFNHDKSLEPTMTFTDLVMAPEEDLCPELVGEIKVC